MPRRLEALDAGNPAWKPGEGLLAHFEAGAPTARCLLVRGVAERRLFPPVTEARIRHGLCFSSLKSRE